MGLITKWFQSVAR